MARISFGFPSKIGQTTGPGRSARSPLHRSGSWVSVSICTGSAPFSSAAAGTFEPAVSPCPQPAE